jgi:hypothetical protein
MPNQYTIASKCHKEGMLAHNKKIPQYKNPYNKSAVRDSDEWLRYQNWHNGWNFAMVINKKPRRK